MICEMVEGRTVPDPGTVEPPAGGGHVVELGQEVAVEQAQKFVGVPGALPTFFDHPPPWARTI